MDEIVVREDAADARHALVGVDSDQRMHAGIRLQFVAPASLRCRPPQADRPNLANLHSAPPVPDVLGARPAR